MLPWFTGSKPPLMDSLPSLFLSYCLSFFVFSTLCPTLFLSLSLYRTPSCSPSLSPHFCPSTTCLHVNANLRGRVSEACGWRRVREGSWEGRGFCLFGQMHAAISGLLSAIKGADDVEQIHGPCLISPCSGPHPLS